jgi:polygalacturonase
MAGTFVIGIVESQSNVTLLIASGEKLLGSADGSNIMRRMQLSDDITRLF